MQPFGDQDPLPLLVLWEVLIRTMRQKEGVIAGNHRKYPNLCHIVLLLMAFKCSEWKPLFQSLDPICAPGSASPTPTTCS